MKYKESYIKSEWFPKLLRKQNDVLEIHERARPILQLDSNNNKIEITSFGRIFNASKTEVKEIISNKTVLQLIYQLLKEHGLEETFKELENESKIKCIYLNIFISYIF